MSYYTLYWRKDAGRYYYRTNNPDGTRSTGRSTGEKTKAKANDYCQRLIQEGMLWQGSESTFESYININKWFVPDECAFLKDRLANSTEGKPGISESYIKRLRLDLRNYLLPYFGKMKLRRINPEDIRAFRTWLRDNKKLSNKSINNAIATLKIITSWALDNNVIYRDPFRGVKQLKTGDNARDAFLLCEARRILRMEWKRYIFWLYSFTAALTGMRLCEIGAIRDATLFEDYIDVKDQWKGKLVPVKTKEARKVPIPARLSGLLRKQTGKGEYTFRAESGKPVYLSLPPRHLDSQMPPDVLCQKKERKLSFHSWRHFFNTYLLSENIPLPKIQAVMGHSTGKGSMTENYEHFQPYMFQEVYAAQNKLLDMLLEGNVNVFCI